ncbi:hypothetical protein F8388_022218 [Cannabis sativa]|uniref:RING-type domain-containing protein n=1 Tax=Cannabis sativa TaxID=3483 RepID=A0A7J6E820_CANSA|nr:hypothetical protein F8388_022218 [Cannabis sativa]KAF4366282.1 hypothetical protein G4B88_030460 [Cannabis sativa]
MNLVLFFWLLLFTGFSFSLTLANVVLLGKNVTLSFGDIEANFAPAIRGSGECGILYLAQPLNACSPLSNKVQSINTSSPFVLIVRGGCSFEDKVRSAQKAGFKAAIIYDNEDGGILVAKRPRASRVREFHGMSSRLVKAMPSLIFTAVSEDNCTSATCAICLEDYSVGEKLRILPCRHKFHAFCVDSWLTSWRTFCPVCKRDARTSTGNPPASESTPLLSSSQVSLASSSMLSSMRSSLASSSAIQIGPSMSRSPSLSRSIASTSYFQQSLRSYRQSPSLGVSRSSMDLQNASSQRSHAYLISGHSLGYPSLSPLNSRYLSTHIPSPSNASPPFVSSSTYQQNPLHCSDSAASFSPFTSAHSLPDC